MSDPKNPVRCSECGLLSRRPKGGETFIEADAKYRRTGLLEAGKGTDDYAPYCFIQQFDLDGKFNHENTKDNPGHVVALGIIKENRDCQRFIKWRQGFSAKEHVQMEHAEKIRDGDQQWQKSMEKMRMDWQDEQRRKDRIWRVVFGFLAAIGGALLTYYMAVLLNISRDGRPIVWPN